MSYNEEEDDKVGALDSDTIESQADIMADRIAKSKMAEKSGGSASDTASSAMMMSGNPYTMAAGATLKTISSINDKKRAERQAKADAENKRRANLVRTLGSLGSGVGGLGM